MKTKICCHCKKEKLLSEFSKNRTKKDGLRNSCKLCDKESMNRYCSKPENKEKRRQSTKRWSESNKDKVEKYLQKPSVKVARKKARERWYKRNKIKVHKRITAARRKRELGISPEYYDSKYKEQQGCCAICGIHQSELKRALSGDHSHITGKPRGLLCGSCNPQLGYYEKFINDKDLVERFNQYLKMYE